MLNGESILRDFFTPEAFEILFTHGKQVAEKALSIAEKVPHLNPDTEFIQEAALLHDIGVCRTNAPGIHCHGPLPYIFHGVEGRKILDKLNLPKHGLVAERHTGAGITREEIILKKLGLPERDLVPISIEEIIICYADKFFSKNPKTYREEKPIEKVISLLGRYGPRQREIFLSWARLFGEDIHGG